MYMFDRMDDLLLMIRIIVLMVGDTPMLLILVMEMGEVLQIFV